MNCFRRDLRIPSKSAANPADYKEPRFDQGHLANDADLKDDLTDQINTYVMSNMSPQECRFNRGIWLSLESLTADIEAAARADALLGKGDLDGQRVWLRILKAIDEMQKTSFGKAN